MKYVNRSGKVSSYLIEIIIRKKCGVICKCISNKLSFIECFNLTSDFFFMHVFHEKMMHVFIFILAFCL